MGLTDLRLEVGLTNFRCATELLEVNGLLPLLRILLLFLKFVLVLAVIQVLADRRSRRWGNLNKIESALLRLSKCFVSGADSQLIAVFIKDAHLRYANL